MKPIEIFHAAYKQVKTDFERGNGNYKICSICGNRADVLGNEKMSVEGEEIVINTDLCEGCYDNIRYAIEDMLDNS